jgi:excisionase family DNA binding protein
MSDSSASKGKFLKVSHVAREIGISPPTVRRLVREGRLAGHDTNGLFLIERTSFEQFLQCTNAQPLSKAA